MKKIIFISILVLSVLSACSKSNPFDESMRAGKDALLDGNYEEAVKQFDISLIEEPTNEDAIALFDRAEKSLKEKNEALELEKTKIEMGIIIDSYVNERDPIVSKINEWMKTLNDNEFAISEKKVSKSDIQDLSNEVKSYMDSRRDSDGIISLTYFRLNLLDDKLLKSIQSISGYFEWRSAGSGSIFGKLGLKDAAEKLNEWKSDVDKYK